MSYLAQQNCHVVNFRCIGQHHLAPDVFEQIENEPRDIVLAKVLHLVDVLSPGVGARVVTFGLYQLGLGGDGGRRGCGRNDRLQ